MPLECLQCPHWHCLEYFNFIVANMRERIADYPKFLPLTWLESRLELDAYGMLALIFFLGVDTLCDKASIPHIRTRLQKK